METKMSSAEYMPIKSILSYMENDLITYGESLKIAKENANYFTEDNNYQHKYWTDWFNGYDCEQY